MNKYLVIFLRSGGFFGLAMGLFYTLQYQNVSAGVRCGLVTGILFGVSMAALSYLSDQKLKKKGIDTSSAHVRRSHKISVTRTARDLIPTCKKAILLIKNSSLKKEDTETGTLIAKMGMSWNSFGETLEISLKPLADGRTLIRIASSPSLPTTIVDFGKNLENVETVVSYIKQELGDEVRDCA